MRYSPYFSPTQKARFVSHLKKGASVLLTGIFLFAVAPCFHSEARLFAQEASDEDLFDDFDEPDQTDEQSSEPESGLATPPTASNTSAIKPMPSGSNEVSPFAQSSAGLSSGKTNTNDVDANADSEKLSDYMLQRKNPAEMTEDEFYKTLTPAEEVILFHKPESGPQLFKAAIQIAKVGRPDFAKLLAEKSLSASGLPQEYAAAFDEIGTDDAFVLVSNAFYGLTGTQASEKAFQEAQKYWESPEFLQGVFDSFGSGTDANQAQAITEMHKGANAAILFLVVQALSDDKTASDRAVQLLPFFDVSARDACLAALETTDEADFSVLTQWLGTQKDERIAPILLGYYYGRSFQNDAARTALEEALKNQLGQIPPFNVALDQVYQLALQYFQPTLPVSPQKQAAFWKWDATQQQLGVSNQFLPFLQAHFAAFYSQWALKMISTNASGTDSDNADILTLALVATSEQQLNQLEPNLDQELESFQQTFPNQNATSLENALKFALKTKHYSGAVLPVCWLAQCGDETLCYGQKTPSALIQAATAPDRLLRFAALQTVATLNPQQPYIGSSRVIDSLIQLTTSTGSRKIVVAFPDVDEGMKLGHYLVQAFAQPVTRLDFVATQQNLAQLDADFTPPLPPQPGQTDAQTKFPREKRQLSRERFSSHNEQPASESLTANEATPPQDAASTSVAKSDTAPLSTSDSKAAATPNASSTTSEPTTKPLATRIMAAEILATDAPPTVDEIVVHQESPQYLFDADSPQTYSIIPVSSGSEILEAVQQESDVEFVVATSYIKTPDLRVVAQSLRNDYRTSHVPLLIGYAESARTSQAQYYGNQEPNALVLPLPIDIPSAQWTIERLFNETQPAQISPDVRLSQARVAAQMLAHLVKTRPNVYHVENLESLIQRLVFSPVLSEEGLALAEESATTATQCFLTGLIGDNRFDLDFRQKALAAFAANLQKNGSKLRGPDILRIYDRYNASEKESPQIQQLLSDMLDAYELVTKK